MTENDLKTLILFNELRGKLKRCPRIRELGEHLGISGTSAHGRLQRLVDQKFMAKGQADMTGTYKLTDKGRARIAEVLEAAESCPTCGRAT